CVAEVRRCNVGSPEVHIRQVTWRENVDGIALREVPGRVNVDGIVHVWTHRARRDRAEARQAHSEHDRWNDGSALRHLTPPRPASPTVEFMLSAGSSNGQAEG